MKILGALEEIMFELKIIPLYTMLLESVFWQTYRVSPDPVKLLPTRNPVVNYTKFIGLRITLTPLGGVGGVPVSSSSVSSTAGSVSLSVVLVVV